MIRQSARLSKLLVDDNPWTVEGRYTLVDEDQWTQRFPKLDAVGFYERETGKIWLLRYRKDALTQTGGAGHAIHEALHCYAYPRAVGDLAGFYRIYGSKFNESVTQYLTHIVLGEQGFEPAAMKLKYPYSTSFVDRLAHWLGVDEDSIAMSYLSRKSTALMDSIIARAQDHGLTQGDATSFYFLIRELVSKKETVHYAVAVLDKPAEWKKVAAKVGHAKR